MEERNCNLFHPLINELYIGKGFLLKSIKNIFTLSEKTKKYKHFYAVVLTLS